MEHSEKFLFILGPPTSPPMIKGLTGGGVAREVDPISWILNLRLGLAWHYPEITNTLQSYIPADTCYLIRLAD